MEKGYEKKEEGREGKEKREQERAGLKAPDLV